MSASQLERNATAIDAELAAGKTALSPKCRRSYPVQTVDGEAGTGLRLRRQRRDYISEIAQLSTILARLMHVKVEMAQIFLEPQATETLNERLRAFVDQAEGTLPGGSD